MRRVRRSAELLIGSSAPRQRARGNWKVWIELPSRLAANLRAIGDDASAIVGYPSRHRKQPRARVAPCQFLHPAQINSAKLSRLQALERSYGGRYTLVAYRVPRHCSNSRA